MADDDDDDDFIKMTSKMMLASADEDEDGKLNLEEFTKMMDDQTFTFDKSKNINLDFCLLSKTFGGNLSLRKFCIPRTELNMQLFYQINILNFEVEYPRKESMQSLCVGINFSQSWLERHPVYIRPNA